MLKTYLCIRFIQSDWIKPKVWWFIVSLTTFQDLRLYCTEWQGWWFRRKESRANRGTVTRIYLETLKKTMKFFQINRYPVDFQSEHLQDASLESYRYANVLVAKLVQTSLECSLLVVPHLARYNCYNTVRSGSPRLYYGSCWRSTIMVPFR
jgi:hypothetical protein